MSELFITLKINEAQLEEVQKTLAEYPNLQKRVVVRAINDTLAGAKTDSSALIRTVLAARKSDVDACLTVSKADIASLKGKMSILGKIPSLMAYGASQTNKGVTAKVYVSQPRQLFESTFIASVKAGTDGSHTDVFKRTYKGAPVGRPIKKAWKKMPEMYRLPIKKVFGPRITTIAKDAVIFGQIQVKAAARLEKNVDKELNYELLKLAGK